MESNKGHTAQTVIDILGGIDATAELIGRHRSVVNRWLRPKDKGGTAGRVPPKHWPKLVSANPQLITLEMLNAEPHP